MDLTINGRGARVLAVNGNDETRAFGIAAGTNTAIKSFAIKSLAIKNGRAIGIGGGIYNTGTLALSRSTATTNAATTSIDSDGGVDGGIYNNTGAPRLINSTISTNTTNGRGGGILNGGSPGVPVLPTNTIIAGNTAGIHPDASGTFSSQGYNLIGNTSGSAGWGSSDLLNSNPLLGPLQNNGGPTNTHALRTGSPAINTIPRATNGCGTDITTDQRGLKRPQGSNCDTGSFEKKKTRGRQGGDFKERGRNASGTRAPALLVAPIHPIT